MNTPEHRLPVLIGIGECTHRTKEIAQGLEPVELMARALLAAESDIGEPVLRSVDSLDIVCEYSWPYAEPGRLLRERLGVSPARLVYGAVGGETPVQFIHDAAIRIAKGDSEFSAVVGAESTYSVNAAAKLGVEPPWHPRDRHAKLVRGPDFLHPVAVRHGVSNPANVYPFYENAASSQWGQSPAEASQESGELWARFSEVAASNPHAWLPTARSAQEIITPADGNRMIAWPYTKSMVANPSVNMGAAVILTSRGRALELGLPENRLVYVWGGAAAREPRDYLLRDQFHRSRAQDAVLAKVLALVGGDAAAFEMLELYSCFPVVPKMARRTLGLPEDAPMTSTGGLSFFGAPLNNYMTHAAAGLVRALRKAEGSDKAALLYGQGEYVTKHHALVMASKPPANRRLEETYSVQTDADARYGKVPRLIERYDGPASVETFTILYDRGVATHGVVIGLTPSGERLMAGVPVHDTTSLDVLTDPGHSPVGCRGHVSEAGDGLLRMHLTRSRG